MVSPLFHSCKAALASAQVMVQALEFMESSRSMQLPWPPVKAPSLPHVHFLNLRVEKCASGSDGPPQEVKKIP